VNSLAQLAFYFRYAVRSLWRGGQRTGLALACIAFGVMSLVAMQSVSGFFLGIFQRDGRDTIGGDAALYQPGQAAASKSDVGPAQQFTAEQIAQLAAWRADGTLAAVDLEATTRSGMLKPEGASRVHLLNTALGVDPTTYPLAGELKLRQPNLALAQALADPGSAAVTRDLAANLGLSVGSRFTLDVGSGAAPLPMHVTAIVDGMPDRSGNTVLYSLSTARQLYGFADVVNRAGVNWGAQGAVAQRQRVAEAGWGVLAARVADQAIRAQNVVIVFTFMLKGAGVLGLLIGGIGVANTMQVLLARRRLEIAVLKTHGYRQRDLWALFGVETGLLGLLGAALGALAAVAATGLIVGLVQQLASDTGTWSLDPWVVAGGMLAGIATTVIFGLEAVARASVVRPAVLLRELPEARNWKTILLIAGLYALLALAFLGVSSLIMGSVVQGLGIIGLAIAGLIVLGLLFGAAVFVLVRLPLPGQSLLALARSSLRRRPMRVLFALIALFAGVFAISLSTMALTTAVQRAAQRQVAATGDNIWVYGLASDEAQARAALAAQGVQDVRISYQLPAQLNRPNAIVQIALTGHSPEANGQEIQLDAGAGAQWDTALDAAYVPHSLAADPWNLKPGDTFVVKLATGQTHTLRVAGYYSDGPNAILLPPPGIVINAAAALALGGPSTRASFIGQAPVEQLAHSAQALGQSLPALMVTSKADIANQLNAVYNGLVKLVFAVAGLALLAGAVLIANAVGLAMVERQRELGILKAVGYSSRSVLQVILLENGLLGLLAGVVGMAATAATIPILNRLQPALAMQFNLPLAIGMAGLSVALALLAAWTAAWGPTHVRPLTVLRNE
jgi:putative ABC transport system permease protein